MTAVSDLITKVRRRSGLEQSNYVSVSEDIIGDDEITDYINEGAAYLHEVLALTQEDYFVSKVELTVASPNFTFDLPSDFFKFRALDKVIGDGYASVASYTLPERNDFDLSDLYYYSLEPLPRYHLDQSTVELKPKTAAPGTYLLRYTPQFQVSSDISFPENWNGFVIVYACIQCLLKLNFVESANNLEPQLGKLERMIIAGSQRRGQPRTMLRVRNRRW